MTDKTPDSDVGGSTPISVPVTANTGAILAVGLDLQEGKVIPRKQVVSWALWDWATQPFNTVITTFVFSVYITSSLFIDPSIAALGVGHPDYDRAIAGLSSGIGIADVIAALAIFALAPVLGQRSDASGRRKFWLGVNTGVVILCMAAMFFVEAKPAFFVLGAALIAAGNVFAEIAGVNYNAMLVQVSTPRTVGKVSGLGWGFGYLGGIVVLVLLYFTLIAGDSHLFGIGEENGLNIRVVAVVCALWTLVFSIPILLFVPEVKPDSKRERVSFFRSYAVLAKDIVRLYHDHRHTFWFLLASAVFRDGLAGVFRYGGIIAGAVFGFTFEQVLIFGIAANVVAGISTMISGFFDDRFGSRVVILVSLGGLVVTALTVFFAHDGGMIAFWVLGLILCLFVGPAQAASRSFLARVTPAGHEGQVFGLYATTGRAVSILTPTLWTILIAIFGATYWGILGVAFVLALGFVLLLLVKLPPHVRQSAKASIPGSLS